MPRKRRQQGGIDTLGSGRYRVRVTDPATGERISLGTFAAKADAENAYVSAVGDMTRGVFVDPRRGSLTLKEYSDRWIETRLTSRGEPLRPRVRELYESLLRVHIVPSLGKVNLSQLNTATVRKWHSTLVKARPAATTAAKSYRLLRAILSTAVEDGLIAVNPCTIRGAGVEHAPERPIISPAQVYAIADAVEPRYRALVLLAAFGGLRRGELFGLEGRHVDLLHRTITVEQQRQQLSNGAQIIDAPKTEAGRRTFVIPSSLVTELEAHLQRYAASGPDGLVFPGEKGGVLHQHVWHGKWDEARKAVGLEGLHFHDLRHVAGTLAAATGAGTKELMHRLGHASPRAALIYQHATRERDTAIADAIGEVMASASSR